MVRARITTATVTALDQDELRDKLDRHGDFEHAQLSAGPFRGKLIRSEIGDSILNVGTYSQDAVVRGTYPEDRITLGMILSAREAGRLNGRRLSVNDIVVFTERSAMEQYLLPAGTHRLVLQTPRDQLERQGVNIPERSKIVFHSRFSPEVLELNRCITAFIESQIRSDGRESGDALVLEDKFIAGFRRAIDASAGSDNSVHRLAVEKRLRALKNLEEFLEARLTSGFRIPDLAAHLGISQRSLEVLCNDVYGISPRRYLTLKRLNAVRKQLLRAKHSDFTIAEVARLFGFTHLGRFASTYRSHFGELPSQTFRRAIGKR